MFCLLPGSNSVFVRALLMQCHKCRQAPPAEGDTWCLSCAGWEALGRELCSRWPAEGARKLAADLVVSCTRQVRGLRNYAQAVRSNQQAASRRREAEDPPRENERPSLKRRKPEHRWTTSWELQRSVFRTQPRRSSPVRENLRRSLRRRPQTIHLPPWLAVTPVDRLSRTGPRLRTGRRATIDAIDIEVTKDTRHIEEVSSWRTRDQSRDTEPGESTNGWVG